MQPLREVTVTVALSLVWQIPPPSWPLCNLSIKSTLLPLLSGWTDGSRSIRMPENRTKNHLYFLLSFATGVEPGMQNIKKPWLIDNPRKKITVTLFTLQPQQSREVKIRCQYMITLYLFSVSCGFSFLCPCRVSVRSTLQTSVTYSSLLHSDL